jgi:hypothetical protein
MPTKKPTKPVVKDLKPKKAVKGGKSHGKNIN